MFTCVLISGLGIGNGFASNINLNNFIIMPPECADCGSIAGDGLSATLTESLNAMAVSLENYAVSVPTGALELTFDFLLALPSGNVDYFDFFIYDTPYSTDSNLLLFQRFTTLLPEYSGTSTYDVTSLGGKTVALIFGLTSDIDYDLEVTSSLTISNLMISDESQPGAVPLPPTLVLFGSGLVGMAFFRTRMRS